MAHVCCCINLLFTVIDIIQLYWNPAMTEDLYEAAVVGWLSRGPGVNTASWPRALGFSLPSSMSEPSNKLPTNRLWQRSGDISSRIRWQKTVTSMMLVGSLHWLLGEHSDEAAMMDRPTWPGHKGGLQPTAVSTRDPKFNCPQRTKCWKQSHEWRGRFFFSLIPFEP